MSLNVELHKRLNGFTLDTKFETDTGTMGLLGASGCGKSLTLRCIAGIERPDAGRIVLNGRVLFDSARHINLPPRQRRVGYLFQNYALFPNMTVAQNISCGLYAEKDRTARRTAVAKMMNRMQLEGLENHRPCQLSGGQQQRTALARILVGQPELLLLDEPFSALDGFLKEKLLTEMHTLLTDYGTQTLMVTHNRDEVYELCETLAIMEGGHLVGHAPTKAMFADPGTRAGAVLTGCKNIVAARKVGDTMVEVPEWGVCLQTACPVKNELCAVGIREYDFQPQEQRNSFPVKVIVEIEEPFAWTIKFRYETQSAQSTPIWWRITKENRRHTPAMLGVAPQHLMLLYD